MKWLLLAFLLLPACAAAQSGVPDKILIRPVASCDENGACVMSQDDLKKLQEFHRQNFDALNPAAEKVSQMEYQIESLQRLIARYASRCEVGRGT